MNYIVEKLHLNNKEELLEIKLFLSSFELAFEENIDYTVVIRVDGKIVATCSKSKDVLKAFAVNSLIQGEGITNLLIKAIQDQLFKEGIYHSFIFTKPEYQKTFESFGYKIIAKTLKVILLEYGFESIMKHIEKIQKKYNLNSEIKKTALVMNCNPFTRGHRYLIEKASQISEQVLVFIVEEEKSLFPFEVRYNLTKEGVADLKNVIVIPGGKYIISSATFPAYFLREKTEFLEAYTRLDATIFAKYFCEKLNITKRMLGEEPYCPVTKIYNENLKEVLERSNVKVEIIKRKAINTVEDFISASKVRESIKHDKGVKVEHLIELIPEITLDYLRSEEGSVIVEKIINSNTRH